MSRELLQQALDVIKKSARSTYSDTLLVLCNEAISSLEAELAKPEQEPVAWAAKSIYGGFEGLSFEKQPRFDTPLYALEVTK